MKHLKILFVFTLLFAAVLTGSAQQVGSVSGTISDTERQGLIGATISIADFKLVTVTNASGHYRLDNVPQGRVRMLIKYIGKQDIDTIVNLKGSIHLNFTMKEENFHLDNIVVVARTKTSGSSTSSYINRNAIDHLQATSLADVLALAPGAISTNQQLNKAGMATIRGVSDNGLNQINSFGTAIILDGAPLSNNANLSALNPSLNGAVTSMAGGASANAGIDTRDVSTDNIESVEIIRGIPSVEYSDLTSGAIILHTKAGREPFRVSVKANPNIYEASLGSGWTLGEKLGALNVSGDYAYSNNKVTNNDLTFQRINTRLAYSNGLFNNKLRTNTSLSFNYSKDQLAQNPDLPLDKRRQEDYGLRLNTNGLWQINQGWLRNIRYVLQASYVSKQGMTEAEETAANAVYSGTLIDGTTLSNRVGQHVYDANHQELTHFGASDVASGYYAHYLPNGYVSHNEIDSREVNVFGKLTANLFKSFGNLNNGLLFGAEFKLDGNEGEGTKWSVETPPYRSVTNFDGSYRPRRYKDIPYIKLFSLYTEDNLDINLGQRTLRLQAGLRYDHASVVGGTVSPRFNTSIDILPNILTFHAGYGITAKMPTLVYLYPERAYYEYVHINELTNESIPEADRILLSTTKTVETQNKSLRIAKNFKREVGIDLRLGTFGLNVTGFTEHLYNGYSLGNTLTSFLPFDYAIYMRNASNQLVTKGVYPILSPYYTPINSQDVRTKGVEFELTSGYIKPIRTSFQLNGSWLEACYTPQQYEFYDNSNGDPSVRKNIAIYAPKGSKDFTKQFVTTLRATHNIPRIGFVVTLTAQAIWNQSNWAEYENDLIPVGFMDLQDHKAHFFEPGKFSNVDEVKAAGYDYLLRNVSHADAIKETVKPYFQFNINVTKEISNIARVSFFANNFFRSYPIMKSKRYPGVYNKLNSDFFFGMEMSLKL